MNPYVTTTIAQEKVEDLRRVAEASRLADKTSARRGRSFGFHIRRGYFGRGHARHEQSVHRPATRARRA
jgi:hypothetical protein